MTNADTNAQTETELSLVEKEEQSMIEAAAWTAANRGWTGTRRDWIAPFHVCPRCGESLDWQQEEDLFDRPFVRARHCGVTFSAPLTETTDG